MKSETWPVYLDNLRKLPQVREAKPKEELDWPSDLRWDGALEIATATRRHRLLVEEKRGTLNSAMAEQLLSRQHRQAVGEWILFAPYVTPLLAERLGAQHVNFIDAAGNCHLELPPSILIHVVGRPPAPRASRNSLSISGYRVLLALLVAPNLANVSVRELAAKAGVSKSTAADALKTLAAMGFLHSTRKGKVLEANHLLDRWVAGYADQLRPSLVVGRYHPADKDLQVLESRWEVALGRRGVRWAFTGGAAAQRLTNHYRGETTAIYLERPVPDLTSELRIAPSAQGSVTLLLSPGAVVFDEMPLPGTAPPVLVYAELLADGGERAREAAELIRARYLAGLS